MITTVLLVAAISFFTVYFVAPSMKRFLERIGIVGTDQQKVGKPKMATSAGMLVIMGIILGGFFFIGVNLAYFGRVRAWKIVGYNPHFQSAPKGATQVWGHILAD